MQVEERAIVRHWSEELPVVRHWSEPTGDGARQIQPPVTGPDGADITGRFLVGFLRDEVLLQQVRCDVKAYRL